VTIIRVNPDSLKQSAQTIKTISNKLLTHGDELWHSADKAPSYDGQFSPLVGAITLAALAQSKKSANRLDASSSTLINRALAFQAVDMAGLMGLQKSVMPSSTSLDSAFLLYISSLLGLSMFTVIRLIRLGMIGQGNLRHVNSYLDTTQVKGLFGGLFGWISGVWNGFFGSKQEETHDSGEIDSGAVSDKNDKSFYGISGKVKLGAADSVEFGYPRNGYGGVQSNCTWYAAQAVSVASDGKVNTSLWGPATQWVINAKAYLTNNPDGFIDSIDSTPQQGDVMHLSMGHVAFIENVEIQDGKTFITWSEENASGSVGRWSDVEQIQINGESILRWRIKREFDQNFLDTYNPQFIHIKY